MESWVFLLVGGVGAIGAAMTLGTIAAMVQYRRTGRLPGLDEEDDDRATVAEPDDGAVMRRLVVRIVVGAVVAVICFMVLAEQGLLGGPVLG